MSIYQKRIEAHQAIIEAIEEAQKTGRKPKYLDDLQAKLNRAFPNFQERLIEKLKKDIDVLDADCLIMRDKLNRQDVEMLVQASEEISLYQHIADEQERFSEWFSVKQKRESLFYRLYMWLRGEKFNPEFCWSERYLEWKKNPSNLSKFFDKQVKSL